MKYVVRWEGYALYTDEPIRFVKSYAFFYQDKVASYALEGYYEAYKE